MAHTRILDVNDLCIDAHFGKSTRKIVTGLDLHLSAGETVGIVGESGSGKSLTARALVGLLPDGVSATGSIRAFERELVDASERDMRGVRGKQLSLLMQDPYTMLNPLMRVGDQILETVELDRSGRDSRRNEAARRLAEVGITQAEVQDRYPFQLSGGMRQRVAIAAALSGDPSVLIADEPTTALDVTTQKEVLSLIRSLQRGRGMGMVLITHDLRVAFAMCDRLYVLYAGALLEVADARELEIEPLHPYTLGLLLSEPSLREGRGRLTVVDGSVPDPKDVADCCPFAPRCAWRAPVCDDGQPPLREVSGGRFTSCARIELIRPDLAKFRTISSAAHQADSVQSAAASTVRLVEIEALTKVFASAGRRGYPHAALKGVSIEIGAGESVGLVGESGSGKTTLARCLVGLETPTSGRIAFQGQDVTLPEHRARQREVTRSIQMVFQDPYSSLNPALTVGATLREAIQIVDGRAGVKARRDELLELVGLSRAYANRKPIALSGGERQRAAIARALAVRPKLLVCDEPVSALDVTVQAQIINLFQSLRDELGIAYLFITHDLAVLRQIAERVYVLYRGELVESGAVREVLEHPSDAYTAALLASVPRSDSGWLPLGGEDTVTSAPTVLADGVGSAVHNG